MESMLEFEESFFKGEEIDGFYVESDMKCAWAAQLEVLAEIDRICKKYNIQYFAEYGTLLGAVRHKGFIPWDDDMDIAMKREDYRRFMEIAPKEIPSSWYLACPQREKNWRMPFMRMVNGVGINISKEHLERFHGCPYTVGVDIFPLDYIPTDKAELEVLEILYEHTLYVKHLIEDEPEEEEKEERDAKIKEYLARLEEDLRFQIDREGNVVNQLLRRLEDLSVLYTEEECNEVGVLCYMTPGTSKQRPKEWYSESIPMQFENLIIPVPKEYEKVLSSIYANWRVPSRVVDSRYPFYKSQKKQVEEMMKRVQRVNERIANLEKMMEGADSEE